MNQIFSCSIVEISYVHVNEPKLGRIIIGTGLHRHRVCNAEFIGSTELLWPRMFTREGWILSKTNCNSSWRDLLLEFFLQ
ncbi:MAG: hypothetical protein Ct9H300mP11_25680 [Chloroflexota bacterium]|nr:MAG: hypothetical protein Ct9H300mP11_25680 [Chloroflexota bacterium]